MIKGLALLAAGEAVGGLRRKAIGYALLGVAALILLFALGYGLNALHIWLSVHFSPIQASLFIAGGLAAVAFVFALAGLAQKNARPETSASTVGTAAMVAAAPVALRAMTTRAGASAILTLGIVTLGALIGRRMAK